MRRLNSEHRIISSVVGDKYVRLMQWLQLRRDCDWPPRDFCATLMRLNFVGLHSTHYWCASGRVVECRICNREVAGSNLGRCYFAPRSTQPSIPPRSVNEFQLRLERQKQVRFIPIADETQNCDINQIKSNHLFMIKTITRCQGLKENTYRHLKKLKSKQHSRPS